MATVRFSQELHDMIVKNAERVYEKQLQAAEEACPSHDWADKIYTILFGQHIAALNAVPTDFFKMVNHLDVAQVCDIKRTLRFDFPSDRPFPPKFIENDLASAYGYYEQSLTLKANPAWDELYTEVAAWHRKILEVEAKRDAFVSQVKTIIRAYATLAPALKAWPALWDLIPEQTKERHREIKKQNKSTVELDVDFNAITAAVAFHKMTR